MKIPNARTLMHALRERGFTRTYKSNGGGSRVIEFIKQVDNRKLEVQLWGDGGHRMSHWHARCTPLGCMCTHPTYFRDVQTLDAAIKTELTRIDLTHTEGQP